jgi:hypothetical protein
MNLHSKLILSLTDAYGFCRCATVQPIKHLAKSVAGREGFEPSRDIATPTHLAGGRTRPGYATSPCLATNKTDHGQIVMMQHGGGRGIRTPGDLRHSCFQDNRLRPLGHPSTDGWLLHVTIPQSCTMAFTERFDCASFRAVNPEPVACCILSKQDEYTPAPAACQICRK